MKTKAERIADGLRGLKGRESFNVEDYRGFAQVIPRLARRDIFDMIEAGQIEIITPSHKINGNEVSNTYYRVK